MDRALKGKYQFFEEFWKATNSREKAPYPILFTEPHLAKDKNYIRHNLVEQHGSIDKLLEESLLYVRPYLSLIDDGIPVIRSDLGTTLIPSGLGLAITVQPNQHPWLKEHMDPDKFLSLPSPISENNIMNNEVSLAVNFYREFLNGRREGKYSELIQPYVPDTQGIFDLAHLVIGSDIFYLFHDDPDKVERIFKKSLELFIVATDMFKRLLGEQKSSMIHGHGMPVGVWFPDTGARISEDSCSLVSNEIIEKYCIPFIKKALKPYGRGFLHYCGKHEGLLRSVCELGQISTINLGNPEMYSLEEIFKLCGKTNTVYFGHLAVKPGEDGQSYLERLADLCGRYKVKLILVSKYHPESDEEKASLVTLWHRLTKRIPG